MQSQSKTIQEILKNRKIIKDYQYEKKIGQQLGDEAIERFQSPIVEKLDQVSNKTIEDLYQKTIDEEDWGGRYIRTATPETIEGPQSILDAPTLVNPDVSLDIELLQANKLPLPSEIIKNHEQKEWKKIIGKIITKTDKCIMSVGGKQGNAKQKGYKDKENEYREMKEELQKYKIKLQSLNQYGTGVFLNPNEMVDRLELLFGSREAGNDSVEIYNEIVDILDKLLNLKYITKLQHKKITMKLQ